MGWRHRSGPDQANPCGQLVLSARVTSARRSADRPRSTIDERRRQWLKANPRVSSSLTSSAAVRDQQASHLRPRTRQFVQGRSPRRPRKVGATPCQLSGPSRVMRHNGPESEGGRARHGGSRRVASRRPQRGAARGDLREHGADCETHRGRVWVPFRPENIPKWNYAIVETHKISEGP